MDGIACIQSAVRLAAAGFAVHGRPRTTCMFREFLLKKALAQGAKSYPILLDENGNVLMTGFNASKAVEILKQLD